jgi:four helix bundle protein
MQQSKPNFLNLRVYRLAELLADEIWKIVIHWNHFSKFTVGKQLLEAADSIGSNIAEGVGRRDYKDNKRFVRVARGALNETRHWLRRANNRHLLTAEQITILKQIVDELGPRLNAYLNSIGSSSSKTTASRQLTPDN